MKILFCILYYEPAWAYGGPPRMCFDVARELVKRGHQVTVCTTDVLDEHKRIDVLQETSHGVRIVRFRNVSNRVAYGPKIFLPIGARRWLKQHVREFDVVHLFDTRTLLNAWAAASAVAARVPFFLSVWGSLPSGEGWKALIKKRFDMRHGATLYGRAARLLAQNEHEAQLYERYGGRREQVQIWPLAVDPQDFAQLPAAGGFRARLGIAADAPLVLFVGRITELKGLDPLLRAFCAARRKVPNAQLAVVGRDDGYLSRMQELAKELGIVSAMHFVGPLYGKDVLPAYVDCDLFSIMPTHFEETSLAALTACAVGRAVLINDRCGIPWLDEYRAGRCVPHDLEVLSAELTSLLEQPAQTRAMGENARRMVQERFLMGRVVDQLESLYTDARTEGSSSRVV